MSKKPRNIGMEGRYADKLFYGLITEVESGDWDNQRGKRERLYFQIEQGGYCLVTSYQMDHPEAEPLQQKRGGRGGRYYASVSDRKNLDREGALKWVTENLKGNEKKRVTKEIEAGHEALKRAWEQIHS